MLPCPDTPQPLPTVDGEGDASTIPAAVVHDIRYDKNSIVNEYTETRDLLEGPFPYLFIFGYPYGKEALTVARIRHMLNQASNLFSNDSLFVSLILIC